MTFAELMAETPAERWASLPVATRDAIGATVVAMMFGELVAEDDGLETTEAEREVAGDIRQEASNALSPMFDAAFPQWFWRYPAATTYEAHDQHGNVLGTVAFIGGYCARFRPASPAMKLGHLASGVREALPCWARRAVDRGGWFGAVLPDGRRYPDDFPRPSLLTASTYSNL